MDKIDLAITESANTVLNNEAILSVSGLFRNTIDTYVRRFIPDIRAYAKARDVIGLRKTASLFLHNSWIILGALELEQFDFSRDIQAFQVKGISKSQINLLPFLNIAVKYAHLDPKQDNLEFIKNDFSVDAFYRLVSLLWVKKYQQNARSKKLILNYLDAIGKRTPLLTYKSNALLKSYYLGRVIQERSRRELVRAIFEVDLSYSMLLFEKAQPVLLLYHIEQIVKEDYGLYAVIEERLKTISGLGSQAEAYEISGKAGNLLKMMAPLEAYKPQAGSPLEDFEAVADPGTPRDGSNGASVRGKLKRGLQLNSSPVSGLSRFKEKLFGRPFSREQKIAIKERGKVVSEALLSGLPKKELRRISQALAKRVVRISPLNLSANFYMLSLLIPTIAIMFCPSVFAPVAVKLTLAIIAFSIFRGVFIDLKRGGGRDTEGLAIFLV